MSQKFKKISNPELLEELKQRLVFNNFTQDEFVALISLIIPFQEEVMKLLQELNPRIHQWAQEKISQLKQERTDQEVEKFKKSLESQPRPK